MTFQPAPGGSIQNRYRGLGQPPVLALKTTRVPLPCGEAGTALRLGVVQGGA